MSLNQMKSESINLIIQSSKIPLEDKFPIIQDILAAKNQSEFCSVILKITKPNNRT